MTHANLSVKEHRKRHIELNANFHELVEDWHRETGQSLDAITLTEFMVWSYEQTITANKRAVMQKGGDKL